MTWTRAPMRSSMPRDVRSTSPASSVPRSSAATGWSAPATSDSSLAYQGAGYGNDMAEMRRLQAFATGGLRPDLTLLVDVPVEIGLERTRRRAEWNRFENTEELAFFEQVRDAYRQLAADEPDRFVSVDGSGSVEDADAAIREVVERRFDL